MTFTKLLITPCIFGLLATLFVTPQVAAQDGPSLEKMLSDSRRAIDAQRDEITKLIKSTSRHYSGKDRSERDVLNKRDRVAIYGLAAMDQLIKEIMATEKRFKVNRLSMIIHQMNVIGTLSPRDAEPFLLKLLAAPKDIQRESGVALAGELKTKNLTPRIIELWEPAGPRLKATIISALAKLQDQAISGRLRDNAESTDKKIRLAVAKAYGLVATSKDTKVILGLTKDQDTDVALAAIQALPRVAKKSSKALFTLHGFLKSERDEFVSAAIKGIAEVNQKEFSKSHLKSLCGNRQRDKKLRKEAAIVLYKMGDNYGREEITKPYKVAIGKSPKRADGYLNLAQIYVEFGDWSSAVKAYAKAIRNERNSFEANRHRDEAARCYARWEKFDKAALLLKESRGRDWSAFAKEEAFSKMIKLKTYKVYFFGVGRE